MGWSGRLEMGSSCSRQGSSGAAQCSLPDVFSPHVPITAPAANRLDPPPGPGGPYLEPERPVPAIWGLKELRALTGLRDLSLHHLGFKKGTLDSFKKLGRRPCLCCPSTARACTLREMTT